MGSYDILKELPPLYWYQEGGVFLLEILVSFLVAVTAGAACHYIIKWLDSDE